VAEDGGKTTSVWHGSLHRNRSHTTSIVSKNSPFIAAIARVLKGACFILGYTLTICGADENIRV
jgi:hypothetical protein